MESRDSSSLSMAATDESQSFDHHRPSYDHTSSSFSCPSDDEVDFLELSDEPPAQDRLNLAGNIIVYDEHGNARPFHTLYSGAEHQGQRQLIIFVRHFFCGACQAYLRALTDTITPAIYFSLPIPTTITIVACGEASLLPTYGDVTRCPFRMYTEPTRKLYKTLGMSSSVNFGPRPQYVDASAVKMVYDVAKKLVTTGVKDGYHAASAAGPMWQVGGEFLFENAEVVWCHRMRNIRGHAEMDVLKTVLGVEHVPLESPQPGFEQSQASPKFGSSHFKSSGSSTYIEPERPGRLRLIIDDSGEVPRASLKRRSVNLD